MIETYFKNATKQHGLVKSSAEMPLTSDTAKKNQRLVAKCLADQVATSQQARQQVTKDVELLGGPKGRCKPGNDQAKSIIQKQTAIVDLVESAKKIAAEHQKRAEELLSAST